MVWVIHVRGVICGNIFLVLSVNVIYIYIYIICVSYPHSNDYVPGIQMTHEEKTSVKHNVMTHSMINWREIKSIV